ncbi:MAG: hypothetical protein JSS40_13615 [Proteobacteria bacterium]|nr:hypothetical protein [Pseudomonadota bacterium]
MPDQPSKAATILRSGIAYFAFVFGAGFVLGSIRVPFLVPRFGERTAELIETPFMFAVVLIAARYITKRYALPPHPFVRLGVGCVGLGLLLAAELMFIAILQRQSIAEYLSAKDPVAGAVFLAMLAIFALMPFILGRVQSAREHDVA